MANGYSMGTSRSGRAPGTNNMRRTTGRDRSGRMRDARGRFIPSRSQQQGPTRVMRATRGRSSAGRYIGGSTYSNRVNAASRGMGRKSIALSSSLGVTGRPNNYRNRGTVLNPYQNRLDRINRLKGVHNAPGSRSQKK